MEGFQIVRLLAPALLLILLARESHQEDFVAEGFFVVDYKAMDKYLLEEDGDVDKAKESLSKDVEYFITDANYYYETLSAYDLNIQLVIIGIQYLDYDIPAPGDIINEELNHELAINKFADFLGTNQAELSNSEYDFAIYLTGYNLDDPVAGYATLRAMCVRGKATGVVEIMTVPHMVPILAHEIGHIFGADHDPDGALTVMAPSATNDNAPEIYTFSERTAQDIKNYFASANVDCLRETLDSSRVPDTTPERYTGRMQDPNVICKRFVGPESSMCTTMTEQDEICYQIACHDEGLYCGFTRPAEGMPCGPSKSCRKGQCLPDSRPITKDIDAECVFGDDLQPEPGKTCDSMVDDMGSGQCGIESFRSKCCNTCSKLATGNPDCEYGDKRLNFEGTVQSCMEIMRNYGANQCDIPSTASGCCDTCSKVKSGELGDCPFGDVPSLNFNGVSMSCPAIIEEYGDFQCPGLSEICCETCGNKK